MLLTGLELKGPLAPTLTLDDLDGWQLGATIGASLGVKSPSQSPSIILDSYGAGVGWFIDATPLDNTEFAVSSNPHAFRALPGSPAASKYDLLTVMLHEIGHLLGFQASNLGFLAHPGTLTGSTIVMGPDASSLLDADGEHLNSTLFPDDLMTATLAPGVRRLPSPIDIQILKAIRASLASAQPLDTPAIGSPASTSETAQVSRVTQAGSPSLVASFPASSTSAMVSMALRGAVADASPSLATSGLSTQRVTPPSSVSLGPIDGKINTSPVLPNGRSPSGFSKHETARFRFPGRANHDGASQLSKIKRLGHETWPGDVTTSPLNQPETGRDRLDGPAQGPQEAPWPLPEFPPSTRIVDSSTRFTPGDILASWTHALTRSQRQAHDQALDEAMAVNPDVPGSTSLGALAMAVGITQELVLDHLSAPCLDEPESEEKPRHNADGPTTDQETHDETKKHSATRTRSRRNRVQRTLSAYGCRLRGLMEMFNKGFRD
jgi:hypothetical protein